MAGLKELAQVEFHGIGGPAMEAQGLRSLFPMAELSIMGLVEVLPKYFHLKRRISEAAAAAIALAPAAVITIDSPDFCLRVAAIVKAARPTQRTIHYVAPSVWAWRPHRAVKMAKVIDHVLALLPFEPPYMTSAGMTCDFVGHPVVAEPLASPAEGHLMDGPHPLILALPGSRRGEVTRLAPVIGETLGMIAKVLPNVRVALPTLPHISSVVRDLVETWPVKPQIIEDATTKRSAFARADVAIAASGTVSLELAANHLPMVIAYKMHPISYWLTNRALLIDTVTLVNLVSETRVVPEFIGGRCRPDLIAPAVLTLLQDRTAQDAAMTLTMKRLGQDGEHPGKRAARSVLAHL